MSKLADKAKRDADKIAREAEGLGQEGLAGAETAAGKLGAWVKSLTRNASAKVVGIVVILTLLTLALTTCG